MNNLFFIIPAFIIVLILLLVILFIVLKKGKGDNEKSFSQLRQEINTNIQISTNNMAEMISRNQTEKFSQLDGRMYNFTIENEQRLDNLRRSMEEKLSTIKDENNKQLDKIRETVDEKLQKTIDSKMSESFKIVSDQLEQVYKSLGEVKNVTSSVGDLKKMLSNVKTRGIVGEIQLSNILTQILSPEQYDENVITKKGSTERVEFAIKLPSDDNTYIYLPIDSKFPGDTYMTLRDALDSGEKDAIESAWKNLRATIRNEAKDISSKYIDVPNTTDFAIMFLPFEGLYSEVVNRGMVEELQRDYKINIAGPSTMAALLNSLQMGFKTLAVQKKSAEVWEVLGSVKTEFETFASVLESAQKRLNLANDDIDKLIGVRTRKIQSKLNSLQLNELID